MLQQVISPRALRPLRKHYDHLPIGILLLDEEQRVVYANPAYRRVLRIGEEKLLDSEVHGAVVEEYARRLRNRDSYTLRLVDDDDDVILVDLFVARLTVAGRMLDCLSFVPLERREGMIETKEREDFIFGRMRVNLRTGLVRYGAELVPFSATEFRLFAFLCSHAERLWTKRELLKEVWGNTATNTRTVDVVVSRIRKKLARVGCEDEYIHTQFGRGYAFLLEWKD
jgi:DNA-binding winged helix-turn-helix (wHTH) protein